MRLASSSNPFSKYPTPATSSSVNWAVKKDFFMRFNLQLKLFLILALGGIFFVSSAFALTNSIALEDLAFQNNVFISTAALDDKGGEVNGYCNASLISSQILVTAAHCIAESLVRSKNQVHIEIGAYKYVSRKTDGKLVRIGYVAFFKKDFAVHFFVSKIIQRRLAKDGASAQIPPAEDIALIILNDRLALEVNFQFANIVPQKIWNDIKNRLNSAQFMIASVNYWDTNTTDFKRSAVLNNISFKSSGWLESQSNARVEEGDSGSPVYINYQNRIYLAGVVKGRASNFFANWDVMPVLSTKVCNIGGENSLSSETLGLLCH